MKDTQNSMVLAYIEEHGSINPMQAITELGIMRLASRISDLKRMGYKIEKRMVAGENRHGEKVMYAEYKIVSDEQADG